ncbi:MAG: IS21 family transposase [Acidobacteria bacterium]|nr:IS21 family transposase [Acidobacteriota bacterium]
MIDSDLRRVVLHLRHDKGMGKRAIARALGISRDSVRKILKRGTDQVPAIQREQLAQPHLDEIVELHQECRGNLVRVHEKLAEAHKGEPALPYSTLTAFCRRAGIGVEPPTPKGRYDFAPGQETQHDTSPHDVVLGGREQRLQCASAVLCFSRRQYAQLYPTFNRFYCKVFLTEAFEFFRGATAQMMVDNTHVVIASGTGKNAVVAPEMEAFAERFGTAFVAHEVGDANRSARVEGPFNFIERNFYPGRTFADLEDLNRQLRAWCEQKSHRFIKTIQARPIDLYQTERLHLRPLPAHIPEVYALHQRIVDLEGYVHLHTNCYSVPPSYIGRQLEVRETKDMVKLFDGPRRVTEHRRRIEGARERATLPEHCPEGRTRPRSLHRPPVAEEAPLRAAGRPVADYLDLLVEKHGRSARRVRRLHRIYVEYPSGAVRAALDEALTYGLTDLERVERMVLRRVAGDYFRLSIKDPTEPDEGGAPPIPSHQHGG